MKENRNLFLLLSTTLTVALAIILFTSVAVSVAHAQTSTVLYNFGRVPGDPAAPALFKELADLTPTDCTRCDFATSVAIGKDTIVASGGESVPEAYVYVKPADGWTNTTETAKLTSSDHGQLWSVAISADGTTVVAASPYTNHIYVFVKPVGGWVNMTETAKLVPTGAVNAGWSVSLSGDTIVVGDPYYANGAGLAYVFVKPVNGWRNMTQTATLAPSDGGGSLGFSVSISQDTVVAGAEYSGAGAAYVFVKPIGGWTEMTETAKLTPSDPEVGFGRAVAVRGDTIVSSAPFVKLGKGKLYVYVRPAGGWVSMTETATLTVFNLQNNDMLGWSVALGKDKVVAGAVMPGKVYVFLKPASGWVNTKKPNARLSAGCYSVAVSDSPPTIVSGEREIAAHVFGVD